jgi:Protein of unknown function (DUF2804)
VRLGINLGNGFEDPSTGAYEDSVICKGKLQKLKVVIREIDENDIESTWKFYTTGDNTEIGSLVAEFTP